MNGVCWRRRTHRTIADCVIDIGRELDHGLCPDVVVCDAPRIAERGAIGVALGRHSLGLSPRRTDGRTGLDWTARGKETPKLGGESSISTLTWHNQSRQTNNTHLLGWSGSRVEADNRGDGCLWFVFTQHTWVIVFSTQLTHERKRGELNRRRRHQRKIGLENFIFLLCYCNVLLLLCFVVALHHITTFAFRNDKILSSVRCARVGSCEKQSAYTMKQHLYSDSGGGRSPRQFSCLCSR